MIVPNAYPDIESKRVRTLGNISMMIFGNYGIRAAANAMQETSRRIIADGGVQNVYKVFWWMRPSESRICTRLRRLKLASFAARCADTAVEI